MFMLDTDHLGILQRQSAPQFGMRRQRIRIGTMDLRIAATALANGMTVLTRNIVDFGRVPNLTVEDWTL